MVGVPIYTVGMFASGDGSGPGGPFSRILAASFFVSHWPLLGLFQRISSFSAWVAIILGYWIIIGAAAGLLFWLIYDWKVRKRRGPITCVGWVLGTFALHCWVLLGLAGNPRLEVVRFNLKERTLALNTALTGYELTLEQRAQDRAAMQTKGDKLALALRWEENAAAFTEHVAVAADTARRRVVRRAWISWAIIAFMPVILFALVSMKKRLSAKSPQADAPGPGEPD